MDVGYCQLGLQFFANRPAALRNAQGSIYKGPARSDGVVQQFEAFVEILERNVSPAAATIMRTPFGFANELSQLVAAAGLRDITIQLQTSTESPASSGLIRWHMPATVIRWAKAARAERRFPGQMQHLPNRRNLPSIETRNVMLAGVHSAGAITIVTARYVRSSGVDTD